MALLKAMTKYGIVAGVPVNDPRNTVFKGIPFARPPVGDLRFAAPQEPERWAGELVCDKWPKACIQYRRTFQPKGAPWRGRPYMPPMPDGSEDCLYLNIWTPAEDAGEKLPVMFWIFGGGFAGGWSASPEFRGDAICRRGIILVTINYRCGALGFLSLPQLTARDPHSASGNYGILDQIMALKWVHENIAAFGGDPANVTIFGQSSGGMSVKFLLCSPLSRGLFKRAIIQSGGGLNAGDPTRPKEEIGKVTRECLELLGWTFDDLMTRDAQELNQRIMDAAYQVLDFKELFFFQPCIDGYSITELPEKSIYEGRIMDADIICGTVAGDSWMFTRKVRHLLLNNEPALRAFAYSPGIAWARHQVNTGRKPIRTYFFERNVPGDEMGASHASDIFYIFGALDCRPLPWEKYDFSLSEAITDYWTNFAKTGDPNGKGLPQWPAFTAATPFTMNFTDDGFEARDLVDNAEANRVINFTIEHPGMLESLTDF